MYDEMFGAVATQGEIYSRHYGRLVVWCSGTAVKTAQVISYFIRNSDPNKLELYFVPNLLALNSLEEVIIVNIHSTGRCNMNSYLSFFVDLIVEGFGREDRKTR